MMRSSEQSSSRRGPGAAGWLLGWLVVWGVVIARHRAALDLPPYFDFAMGIFVEANWLVEHDFDYDRLRSREPVGDKGGARAYVTSVGPTLVALPLAWGASPAAVFRGAHLVEFAHAALAYVALFALTMPVVGRALGALLVAILATVPQFAAQVEMLGLDLPCAAWSLVAGLAALRRRPGLAATAATLAYLWKPTALIQTALVVAVFAVYWWSDRQRFRNEAGPRVRGWVVVGLASLWIAQVLGYLGSGIASRLVDEKSMPLEHFPFWDIARLCPELVISVGLFLAVVPIVCLVDALAAFRQRPAGAGSGPWLAVLGQRPLLNYAAAMLAANVAAVVLYVQFPLPRYFTISLPWLVAGWGVLVADRRFRRWGLPVLPIWLVLNLLNQQGRLLPSLAGTLAERNGPALERSLEYREDFASTLKALAVIDALPLGEPVIASYPFQQYLAVPALGGVGHPRLSYGTNLFRSQWCRPVSRLLSDLPASVVAIHMICSPSALGTALVPPPGEGDEILYHDHRPAPLIVYRRQWQPGTLDPAEQRDQYIAWLWYAEPVQEQPRLDLSTRAGILAGDGQPAAAVHLLHLGLARHPRSVPLRTALAELLLGQGIPQAALLHCQELERQGLASGDVWALAGRARAALGQTAEAFQELERATFTDPGQVEAWMALAELYQGQGRAAEAERAWNAAAAAGRKRSLVALRRGIAAFRAGDLVAAESHLQGALRLQPNLASAERMLGELQLAQRRPDRAIAFFRRALDEDPEDPQTQLGLARAYLETGEADLAQAALGDALRRAPESPAAAELLRELGPKADLESTLRVEQPNTAGLGDAP